MRKTLLLSVAICVFTAGLVRAESFGTGSNQFTIDFVTISGATNPSSGYGFVNNDYRMGIYEITNDQWNKFKNEYGTLTGYPFFAYDSDPYWTGTNVPTNRVSWYEAAQFVNWLNTSTNHAPAYKFTGTQGQSDYTFAVWASGDAGYDASNPYRNSDAYYFLPTTHEWIKAAYWNGTNLQTWATVGDIEPTQDNWNYWDYTNGYATDPYGPWDVGSGYKELNGTYDMMGNVWEWMETPDPEGYYLTANKRRYRGGSYEYSINYLRSNLSVSGMIAENEASFVGFRVASVPEPCGLFLFAFGGLALRFKRA